MQSAKDTFLMTLRDRLEVVNPARTIAVRGAVRAAVVASENELVSPAGDLLDCFLLRWTEEVRDTSEPMPLHAMQCEIRYGTRGTGELAGLDRGRVLAAMDAELVQMLEPRRVLKRNYAATPAVAVDTHVFWSDVAPGTVTMAKDVLTRTALVTVYALEEAEG